ncbi:MAG: hypothetical protein MI757_01065, partial [Pirellulales bacterium]|nr:hypothetical protein [Pirellulales bacterium]
MRTGMICLAALFALAYTNGAEACGRRDCGCGEPRHRLCSLFKWKGIRHCANCDDAPVVVGGPGIECGAHCGGCEVECDPCRDRCHRGGCVCRLFGWLGSHGRCSGCGPKYIPEWHTRPCEPCNRCGDWIGPSLHRGKMYMGPPRSGSNIGVRMPHEPKPAEPAEAVPAEAEPKATVLPERSVRSVRRTSHFSH